MQVKRRSCFRGAALAMLLLGCSQERQAVVVTVDAGGLALPRLSEYLVKATLSDRQAAEAPLSVAPGMNPFTLLIERGLTGDLQVLVHAVNNHQAVLAQGEGGVALAGATQEDLTVPLSLVYPDPMELRYDAPRFYGQEGAWDIAVGDLNRDGLPDVVSTWSRGLAVLLNQGGGALSTMPLLAMTGEFYLNTFTVADLDGDGALDVIGADVEQGGVVWLKGQGDGTLGPAAQLLAPGEVHSPRVLGVGALDSEEGADVALGSDEGVVTVVQKGQGYARGQTFGLSSYVEQGTLADVNGDGALDILALTDKGLVVLASLGSGTERLVIGPIAGTSGAYRVAVADQEIALVDGSQMGVLVLIGDGRGGFAGPRLLPTAEAPYYLLGADVNGDRKPDLVTAGGDGISVLLANGDGSFQDAVGFPAGYGVGGLALLSQDEGHLAVLSRESMGAELSRVGVLRRTSP